MGPLFDGTPIRIPQCTQGISQYIKREIKMNGAKAKSIRNNMYYPKIRNYHYDSNGTIHADEPRKKYQHAKKRKK